MPARQQRAARNRRRTSAANPIQPTQCVCVLAAGQGNAIQMECAAISSPPDGVQAAVSLFVSGIPQIRRGTTGTFPVSVDPPAAPPYTRFILRYAAPAFGPGETIEIQPYDPAVRTADGGYLAAGLLPVQDGI